MTPLAPAASVLFSAYFVMVWGSGFVVTRIALEYAAPFTYIGVRYTLAFVLASHRHPKLAGDQGTVVACAI